MVFQGVVGGSVFSWFLGAFGWGLAEEGLLTLPLLKILKGVERWSWDPIVGNLAMARNWENVY